jgi:hypothetical protein
MNGSLVERRRNARVFRRGFRSIPKTICSGRTVDAVKIAEGSRRMCLEEVRCDFKHSFERKAGGRVGDGAGFRREPYCCKREIKTAGECQKLWRRRKVGSGWRRKLAC